MRSVVSSPMGPFTIAELAFDDGTADLVHGELVVERTGERLLGWSVSAVVVATTVPRLGSVQLRVVTDAGVFDGPAIVERISGADVDGEGRLVSRVNVTGAGVLYRGDES